MSTPPENPYDPSQYGGDHPQYGQPQQPQQPYGHQQPYQTGAQVPPGYQVPAGGQAPPAAPAAPGILGSLFDFTFRESVAPRIIKVLYIVGLVVIGLSALSGVVGSIGAMPHSPVAGVLGLFESLVGGALAVLVTRIALELVLVLLRIGDDLSALRRAKGV
ncbi:hypothetical protein SUDANB121_01569 [Nocardiopsis dassonvillei]|uniref:DUF4282 domain-containing protein n=1 Tax=Nocardiopsis dassonvillei TaxID=2014 RepID=UPI003F56D771